MANHLVELFNYAKDICFSITNDVEKAFLSASNQNDSERAKSQPQVNPLTEKIQNAQLNALQTLQSQPEQVIDALQKLSRMTNNPFERDEIKNIASRILSKMNHQHQYNEHLNHPFTSATMLLNLLQAHVHEEINEEDSGESLVKAAYSKQLKIALQDKRIQTSITDLFITHEANSFSESHFPFKVYVGPFGSIITHIASIIPENLQKILDIITELNTFITEFNRGKSPKEQIKKHKHIVLNGTHHHNQKFFNSHLAAINRKLLGYNKMFRHEWLDVKSEVMILENDPRLLTSLPSIIKVCCMIDQEIFLVPDNGEWKLPDGRLGKLENNLQSAENILKEETGINHQNIFSKNLIKVYISSQREAFTGLHCPTTTEIYALSLSTSRSRISFTYPNKRRAHRIPFAKLIQHGKPAAEIADHNGELHRVSLDITWLATQYLQQIASFSSSIEAAEASGSAAPTSSIFEPTLFLKKLQPPIPPFQDREIFPAIATAKHLNQELLEEMI